MGDKDSPQLHMEDTLKAGANFCDSQAVEILVNEGPKCVEELIEMGTKFDKIEGKFQTTLEAAHQRPRILHAQGDATGAEIERALSEKTREENSIKINENIMVIDILTENNICYGLLTLNNKIRELTAYLAKYTILASGGLGQLFFNTTNPDVATGDGIAFAYRAGATIANLEFIQFHPTGLYHQGSPKFLISESVRGEGAILKNIKGEIFMPTYHPLADLAPRDIVARAITDQMKKTKSNYVYLDATKTKEKFTKRFPTIYKNCMKIGIDPEKEYIPVAPVAHYTMGGIKTDIWGQTNLTNLFACGANRLASNSLLEGLVFGNRITQKINEKLIRHPMTKIKKIDISYHASHKAFEEFNAAKIKKELQGLMWNKVGIIRTYQGLIEAQKKITQWKSYLNMEFTDINQIELANLIILARDDVNWKKSIEY